MDIVSQTTRSKIMSRVGQKNTGPEMKLRKALYRIGLRYRLHDRKLPGSPDIVFPKYRTVVFVHGCFWHRHGCKATTTPKTNSSYWSKKFDDNIERDRRDIEALIAMGWRCAIVWACFLKGKKSDESIVALKIRDWLLSSTGMFFVLTEDQT